MVKSVQIVTKIRISKVGQFSMVSLELLNVDNWQEICRLSVSEEQKNYYPIPNVYWIGISRYEEHTELFAIKSESEYVGMMGCGFDEDGVSGYINPFMIDEKYQGNHYAENALTLCIKYLIKNLNVKVIHLGHRKVNVSASKLYEKMGFGIVGEDEIDYFREFKL